MKTENARTDRAKPIWPSDYSQAGHNNIMPSLRLAEKAIEISLSSLHYNYSTICNADKNVVFYRMQLMFGICSQ